MQAYSNPKRERDPHALPDVEVFHRNGSEIFKSGTIGRCNYCNRKDIALADGYGSEQPLCMECAKDLYGAGWYWWSCFPGCMPDSDAIGPFATEAEALADAQDTDGYDDDTDDDDDPKRMRCDQCEAAMINGVFCHETGCPNSSSRYDAETGEWIEQRKCFDCGCTVDADDPCCSADFDDAA